MWTSVEMHQIVTWNLVNVTEIYAFEGHRGLSDTVAAQKSVRRTYKHVNVSTTARNARLLKTGP